MYILKSPRCRWKTMNKKTSKFPLRVSLAALAAGLLLVGCTASDISTPERSALEQLLLSTAVDNALMGVSLPQVQGKAVYVSETYIESYDQLYVTGSIRALLSENGALLVDYFEEAEMIIEPRVGALGMDKADALLGIPSLQIPVPAVGTVETPEAALYSSHKRDAVAKIALLAYDRDGANVFSTEPIADKAHFHQYRILLLLNLNTTNIPERENY